MGYPISFLITYWLTNYILSLAFLFFLPDIFMNSSFYSIIFLRSTTLGFFLFHSIRVSRTADISYLDMFNKTGLPVSTDANIF